MECVWLATAFERAAGLEGHSDFHFTKQLTKASCADSAVRTPKCRCS